MLLTFFISNGFANIYDLATFKDPTFVGEWGVSDEDLVKKANDVFIAHGDTPFFAVMLSTSNHEPYEYPGGRIEIKSDDKKATRNNAIRYSDYAIGEFFKLAEKDIIHVCKTLRPLL